MFLPWQLRGIVCVVYYYVLSSSTKRDLHCLAIAAPMHLNQRKQKELKTPEPSYHLIWNMESGII